MTGRLLPRRRSICGEKMVTLDVQLCWCCHSLLNAEVDCGRTEMNDYCVCRIVRYSRKDFVLLRETLDRLFCFRQAKSDQQTDAKNSQTLKKIKASFWRFLGPYSFGDLAFFTIKCADSYQCPYQCSVGLGLWALSIQNNSFIPEYRSQLYKHSSCRIKPSQRLVLPFNGSVKLTSKC